MLLIVAATEGELRAAREIEGVDTLVCGVGPVDAASRVAQHLAAHDSITAVLHVGIAGCRRESSHEIGDLVVGEVSVYCDARSALVAQHASPSEAFIELLTETLGCERASIGTSARVGGTSGCTVEAMEGFGVIRAANLAGVPAVEVRCISNEVEESDRSRWDFAGSIDKLQQAIATIVQVLDMAEVN